MADSNLQKRSFQPDFADNDPFAELTRIMGQDTRQEPRQGSGQAQSAETFDIDLERELMGEIEGQLDALNFPGEGGAEPVAVAVAAGEAAEDRVVDAAVPGWDGGNVDEASLDEAFAEEFEATWDRSEAEAVQAAATDQGSLSYDTAEWEPVSIAPAAAEPVRSDDDVPIQASAEADLGLAEVDMDFGDFDLIAEIEDGAPPPSGGVGGYHADPLEADAPEPRSLEDELEMLLAGGSAEGEAAPERDIPIDAAEDDTAPYFGRANFQPASSYEAEDHEDEAEDHEAIVFAQRDADLGNGHAQDVAADAEKSFEGVSAEISDLTREVLDALGHDGVAGDRIASDEDASEGAASLLAIETVEVAESAVPVQDDLDLPDVPFDEPSSAFQNLDDEFTAAFGLKDGPAPTSSPAPLAPDSSAPVADDAFFAEALGYAAPAAAWNAGASKYGSQPDQAERPEPGPLEREIDTASYDDARPVRTPRRRSGMYIAAAAVAAIVLVGGIGVFALSSGSDADGSPALVKADAEPLKVKPENPGGTAVPNQDSKAYERAAGVVDDTPPAQQQLVTTKEEPVRLAMEEPSSMSPSVAEEGAAPSLAGEATGKSEDRIEASAAPEGIGAADDLASVQPRKVRTMIVRPDGSLVAREDPAPAPAAPVEKAPAIAAVQPAPTHSSAPQPKAVELASAEPAAAVALPAADAMRDASANQPVTTAAPSASTVPAPAAVDRAAAKPAPRPAQQPAQPVAGQQVAQAAPAQARPQPAAPAASAAPAGEWSMQIASQPTAEAAQATYQDLARRYGSVIGGHGVSIVKAEIANKGTYYRVRIPSASRDEAISLCEKYKAAGGSCFVSK